MAGNGFVHTCVVAAAAIFAAQFAGCSSKPDSTTDKAEHPIAPVASPAAAAEVPVIIDHKKDLVPIANTTNADRRADIVFIHGLNGDSLGTWINKTTKFYWPSELGKELPDLGIWALNYDAHTSAWGGSTMSIESRSKNLLEVLRNDGIGDRRIVFVAHSLGGVMVKQLLHDANDLEKPDWAPIGTRTKAVIFLGTPNAGSSLPNVEKMFDRIVPFVSRATITRDQLAYGAPILLQLNEWYRDRYEGLDIQTLSFYETIPSYKTVIVVDQVSADPGIPKSKLVAVAATHEMICKPDSKDSLVYKSVKRFIDEEAVKLPTDYKIEFNSFLDEFNSLRNNDSTLRKFKTDHVGQRVTWDCIIRDVTDHKKNPNLSISATEDAKPFDGWVVAVFKPWEFKKQEFKAGERIRLSGILSPATAKTGATLEESSVVKAAPETAVGQ